MEQKKELANWKMESQKTQIWGEKSIINAQKKRKDAGCKNDIKQLH